MKVTKRNGTKQDLDLEKIHAVLEWACEGDPKMKLPAIKGTSVSQIEAQAHLQFYDGMSTKSIQETLIKSAEALISEYTPNYDKVAARLRWFAVRKEAFAQNNPPSLFEIVVTNTSRGIYDPDVIGMYTEKEWDDMDDFIDHNRDDLFRYAGAEQMTKKYLAQNRKTKQVYESFQIPYILVAAILFNKYPKETRLSYVKRAYDLISQHYVSLPTPIMAGLRTRVKQFSSCTLIEVGDSLQSIKAAAGAIVDYASNKAGIGASIGAIRAEGQLVRNGDAVTTGVLPFAKFLAAALKSCSQGAVRGASATFNWPSWHLEFDTLIELKNNKGTDEKRLRNVDYCVHLNKTLLERLITKGSITLFSPEEVPELYDAFYSSDIAKFKELYEKYEKSSVLAKKIISAADFFSKIANERFSTGRIYPLFADLANTHTPFYQPVRMSNLCLTGDTLISTNKGLRSLESLYESQEEFSVTSDVRGYEGKELLFKRDNNGRIINNGYSLGTSSEKSSKVVMTNPFSKVMQITTVTGHSIKVTPSHKILTDRGYVEAGDINEDDFLYLQSGEGVFPGKLSLPAFEFTPHINWKTKYDKKPISFPVEMTDDLAFLMGWLVGDGYISRDCNYATFVVGKDDSEIKEKLLKIVGNLFPGIPVRIQNHPGSEQIIISDRRVGQWFINIGVTTNYSDKKEVPFSIFESPKSSVVAFLNALFSADGTIDISKGGGCALSLASTSRSLLEGVQKLLSNLGIKGTIYSRIPAKTCFMPSGDRSLKEYSCKPVFSLNISKIGRNLFLEKVGLSISRKYDKLKKYLDSLYRTGYSETYRSPILSIVEVGEEPVYDIHVENSHSFIANGVVVHNCQEIYLPTSPMGDENEEIALCTLAAYNLGKLETEAQIAEAAEIMVRMLDELLDYQDYPNEAARKSTMKHRPLGVGVIGFAHWLVKNGLKWGDSSVKEVNELFSHLNYYLVKASNQLAKEKGPTTERNRYSDGILVMDTYTPEQLLVPIANKDRLEELRKSLKEHGIRNATLMALMPSETSSQLANETNGIEPPKELILAKGNKEVSAVQVVPEYSKYNQDYQLAYDIPVKDYMTTVGVMQKYVCQGISANTYYDPTKGAIKTSQLIQDLFFAYKNGLKGLYYSVTNDDEKDETTTSNDSGCEGGACKL